MGASAQPGPLSVTGQDPPLVGTTPYVGGPPGRLDYNPDAGPSLFYAGIGIRDPRYLPSIGAGPNIAGGNPNQDCGWYLSGGGVAAIDQVPSTIAVNNIAVAANVTNGTAMTLVSVAGAGITIVPTGGITILPTGLVVPAGLLIIDGTPAWSGAGQSGGFAFFDPTKGYGRGVSITGAGGSAGGNFDIAGYDIYGNPQTERVTAAAGAATTNSEKAWKFITSVTPRFTNAFNYSIGTADIFEFPIRVDTFAYADITWNNARITSSTGFVAADQTTPATLTTGSPRGTYAVQSASDGTKRLVVFVRLAVANLVGANGAAVINGLVGRTPV